MVVVVNNGRGQHKGMDEWTGQSVSLRIEDDRGRRAVIAADASVGVPQRRLGGWVLYYLFVISRTDTASLSAIYQHALRSSLILIFIPSVTTNQVPASGEITVRLSPRSFRCDARVPTLVN